MDGLPHTQPVPDPGPIPAPGCGDADIASCLETRRLRLRRLRASDADWIWALDQDPEVMRYLGGTPTPREVTVEQHLPRMLRRYPEAPWCGFWAASVSTMDTPIGWFHLRPAKQPPHKMELGYRLARAHWGQGLATEGARELIRFCFEEAGLPSIVAHTLVSNRASRRVMEKCGLRFDSEFIVPAEWLPGTTEEGRRAVWYILTRADYDAARAAAGGSRALPGRNA